MRLIDADALIKAMEEERRYLLARGQTGAEHIIVHHCLPIIDNAPTVSPERPQGECGKCDYRKFTETFIDGIVDVISKNGIADFDEFAKRYGDSYLHQDGITKSDTQI